MIDIHKRSISAGRLVRNYKRIILTGYENDLSMSQNEINPSLSSKFIPTVQPLPIISVILGLVTRLKLVAKRLF